MKSIIVVLSVDSSVPGADQPKYAAFEVTLDQLCHWQSLATMAQRAGAEHIALKRAPIWGGPIGIHDEIDLDEEQLIIGAEGWVQFTAISGTDGTKVYSTEVSIETLIGAVDNEEDRSLYFPYENEDLEDGCDAEERDAIRTMLDERLSHWMAGIESQLASDDVDQASYLQYYHRGLTPADAIREERLDSGVLGDPARIKVSLDGGITFEKAPSGVRVAYERVHVPGEDEPGDLHVNLTSEGIITDLWVSREDHLDHNIGTRSEMLDTLMSNLVEDGA